MPTIREGIAYGIFEHSITLKLALGMTSAARLEDLANEKELIKLLSLPESFAEQLHPYLQEKFRELWRAQAP